MVKARVVKLLREVLPYLGKAPGVLHLIVFHIHVADAHQLDGSAVPLQHDALILQKLHLGAGELPDKFVLAFGKFLVIAEDAVNGHVNFDAVEKLP